MKRLFTYTPNLLLSWGLLGLLFVCQLVATVPSNLLTLIFGTNIQSWQHLFLYVLSFVLMGLIVIQLGKNQSPTATPATERSKTTFPLYILLLFLIPLLSIAIEPLYMWIPMPQWIEELFASMFTAEFATFVMAVIAAPFAEEWLCRGVILKGLLANRMPPYKAIAWSALIFAVMHLNPWQAVPAFCLGFAIGWVYWRTKSLWPCIFMHAVNNGLAFILLLLFPDIPTNASLYDLIPTYYPLIYAGAVMLSIVIGYILWRMIGERRG